MNHEVSCGCPHQILDQLLLLKVTSGWVWRWTEIFRSDCVQVLGTAHCFSGFLIFSSWGEDVSCFRLSPVEYPCSPSDPLNGLSLARPLNQIVSHRDRPLPLSPIKGLEVGLFVLPTQPAELSLLSCLSALRCEKLANLISCFRNSVCQGHGSTLSVWALWRRTRRRFCSPSGLRKVCVHVGWMVAQLLPGLMKVWTPVKTLHRRQKQRPQAVWKQSERSVCFEAEDLADFSWFYITSLLLPV